jgi:predicted O-methyltransferase YrrM
MLTLNPVLAEIYESGVVALPSGAVRPVEENGMPFREGSAIHDLVVEERPRTTLEIGLAFGLSALFICQGLRQLGGGRHIAIDPNQHSDFEGAGLAHLGQAGYADMVTFHEEPAHRVLPRLEADGLTVDLALIDGMHLFDYALVDFFYVDRLLKVGGLLLVDDVGLPSIAKMVRFARTNRGYVEESASPGTRSYRRAGRRFKRIRRGIGSLGSYARFALGADGQEVVGAEIPSPREDSLACLRKVAADDRHWTHFVPF